MLHNSLVLEHFKRHRALNHLKRSERSFFESLNRLWGPAELKHGAGQPGQMAEHIRIGFDLCVCVFPD